MTNMATRFARAEALLPQNALRHVYELTVTTGQLPGENAFWFRKRTRQGPQTFRVDLTSYAVTPFDGFPEDAPEQVTDLPDPTGSRTVFVGDHNLVLRDLETGADRAITTDGVAHYGWGEEPDGTMDATSGTAPPPAACWSTCGRWLLVFRCDEKEVRGLSVPVAGDRPTHADLRIPLVGDDITDTAEFWVIDTSNGARVRVDLPRYSAMESPFWFAGQGMDGPEFWAPDGHLYLTHRTNRGRCQTLYRVDPATGSVTKLVEETDTIPVLLNPYEFAAPNWRVLSNGDIVWPSQRSGWMQLYLYGSDGHLKNAIAPGDYVQRDVLAIDEEERLIWTVTQGQCASGNPYHRHLQIASLDGGAGTVLTTEPADHVITNAPDDAYFIDHFGTASTPSSVVLRDRMGKSVATLAEADATDLFARGYRPPDILPIAAEDDTPIWTAVFTPPDFDPTASYPILNLIYAWNQVTVVPHGFLLDTGGPLDGGIEIAAENAFAPASLAALGFVVVVIDARGTPFRDRAFYAAAFDDPKMALGIKDHRHVIESLAKTRPWMDLSRVGICGHSGGGHMTVKAMTEAPEFYHAGVASAGNHDMRLYHAAWAELYGATPNALFGASSLAEADQLKAPLLLAHGQLDENVHVDHTLRLAQTLVEAGKSFDLLMLPDQHHDFTLTPYFVKKQWDFLVRQLLDEETPEIEPPVIAGWADVT